VHNKQVKYFAIYFVMQAKSFHFGGVIALLIFSNTYLEKKGCSSSNSHVLAIEEYCDTYLVIQ